MLVGAGPFTRPNCCCPLPTRLRTSTHSNFSAELPTGCSPESPFNDLPFIQAKGVGGLRITFWSRWARDYDPEIGLSRHRNEMQRLARCHHWILWVIALLKYIYTLTTIEGYIHICRSKVHGSHLGLSIGRRFFLQMNRCSEQNCLRLRAEAPFSEHGRAAELPTNPHFLSVVQGALVAG
jgi:hypothetical protein